jgi:predicted nucleic acid-binding protein
VIFVDSSYFVAIADRKDRWHRQALRLSSAFNKGLLVSDFVISETVTTVGNRGGSRVARSLFEFLKESCEVEYVDSRLLDEAGNYYQQFDGHLSLSQCAALAIMARRGVSKILSFNAAFDQVEGIERVR